MTVMRMISADMISRYPTLFSREVPNRFSIPTVLEEVRCVLKVWAETCVIGHKYERVRDDGDNESSAGMRVVMQ